MSRTKFKSKQGAAILAMTAAVAAVISGCGRQTNQSAALTGNSLYGGCIPLDQPIPFTATDASADNYRIEAGLMPAYGGRSIGRVELGGAVSGGQLQRASADGTISMQANRSNYQNQYNNALPGQNQNYMYGQTTPTTITGQLTLSQAARERIQATVGNQSQYYYNGGYGNTLQQNNTSGYTACVSGLAFSFQYNYQQLSTGQVFLYLNNSQYMIETLTF